MNEGEPQKIIEEIAREVVTRMGFPADISVTLPEDGETYFCRIQVQEDQNFLIGQHGVNLAALQHIVRALVRHRTGERFSVIVDVNDYFAEKKELLENEARSASEQARATGAPVSLRPMQAYERKIIHAYLAAHTDVTTESEGVGAERKIIVRPKSGV